jgi:hypothetical protein
MRLFLLLHLLLLGYLSGQSQEEYAWHEVDHPPIYPKAAYNYAKELTPGERMIHILYAHLQYPQRARRVKLEGAILVDFSIDTIGSLTIDSMYYLSLSQLERKLNLDSTLSMTIVAYPTISCGPGGSSSIEAPPPTPTEIRWGQEALILGVRTMMSYLGVVA